MPADARVGVGPTRVIGLQVALGGGALGLACGVTALLRDAGASALSLFLFQCALLVVDGCHTLVQWYLRRREAVAASDAASDALYYSVLLPELWLGLCRLCHHLHVWYVHGISFSVIDVLLLANTKAPTRPPARARRARRARPPRLSPPRPPRRPSRGAGGIRGATPTARHAPELSRRRCQSAASLPRGDERGARGP